MEDDDTGGVDTYNFSGWIIGGRNNHHHVHERRRSKPKPSKKVEIDQCKQTKQQRGGWFPHSQGAVSYAYSFTPYQQYQCSPPYHYGGYGGPPQMAGGGHDYFGGSQMVGSGHGYYGGSQMAAGGHGYYGGYHEPGYPSKFPLPNQGGYNYEMSHTHNYSGAQHINMRSSPDHGGAATTGAPVYGHGRQHDAVNKQLGHDHTHGGAHVMDKGLSASGAAASGAAANRGHGQHDTVNKHAHQDHSHGGGHMAMGGAATGAADAAYGHRARPA